MKTSYSFDDILIKPKLSNVISRSHVSLKTKLSDKIKLNIPIISSPMDTVTETNMAIAMSLNGGIGIIHRFQSIDEQVKMVKNVKRHLSYIIEKPYFINKDESIEDLILLNKKLNVSGMMVVDNDNKFVGIVSKKDVQIYKLSEGKCLKVSEIMTPLKDIIYVEEYNYKNIVELYKKYKIEKIPILCKDKYIKGLVVLNNLMYIHNNKNIASLDKNGKLIVGASVGIKDYMERGEELINAGVDVICIDVANGHTEIMKNAICELKQKYPDITIMAGNVCTKEGFEYLCKAGADCIRVGIGNGCYSEDTKVLMANGIYKNINKIEIGEYVINKYGKAVKVLNVINRGERQVAKINTNNWHKDIFVTPDHKYWIGDLSTTSYKTIQSSGIAKLLDKKTKTVPKNSKYKWKQIGEIENEKMFTLMPNKFEWMLPENFIIDLAKYNKRGIITDTTIQTYGNGEKICKRYITSDYKLGYIFGTFLGDGNTLIDNNNYTGSCHWSFSLHEHDIANKVKDYIKELLDYECIIYIKNNNMLFVNCYKKCLTYLLYEFNKRTNKQLPSKYYCTNKEYIKGLYDGLIDSDGHIEYNKTGSITKSFANTSEYLIELFNWCCINLGISFCSMKNKKTIGNLKGANVDNLQQSYNIKTHTLNRYTKNYVYSKVLSKELYDIQETWDIEVDCDTHSFIANNSIVHNSICSTRLQTGIGICQFSALLECSEIAKKYNVAMISDGGHLGKIGNKFKALAVGSSAVMLGKSLAGTTESPGNIIYKKGKRVKYYRGMASSYANLSKQERLGNEVVTNFHIEGIEGEVDYKGDVIDQIQQICNGIRSGMSYVGVFSIDELHDTEIEFNIITQNGFSETKTRL